MCRKIWIVKLSNTIHTAKNTKKQTKSHCQTWDSNLRPQALQSDAFTSKPTGFNKVVLLLILYNVWINIFDRLSREVGITALLWLHFEQIWSQHIDMPSYKHTGNISINILFDINNPFFKFVYVKYVQASTFMRKYMHTYTSNAHSKLFLNK